MAATRFKADRCNRPAAAWGASRSHRGRAESYQREARRQKRRLPETPLDRGGERSARSLGRASHKHSWRSGVTGGRAVDSRVILEKLLGRLEPQLVRSELLAGLSDKDRANILEMVQQELSREEGLAGRLHLFEAVIDARRA